MDGLSAELFTVSFALTGVVIVIAALLSARRWRAHHDRTAAGAVAGSRHAGGTERYGARRRAPRTGD